MTQLQLDPTQNFNKHCQLQTDIQTLLRDSINVIRTRLSASDTLEADLRSSNSGGLEHIRTLRANFQRNRLCTSCNVRCFCVIRSNVDRRHFFCDLLRTRVLSENSAETHSHSLAVHHCVLRCVVQRFSLRCVHFHHSYLANRSISRYMKPCAPSLRLVHPSLNLWSSPYICQNLQRQAASLLKRCHSSCRPSRSREARVHLLSQDEHTSKRSAHEQNSSPQQWSRLRRDDGSEPVHIFCPCTVKHCLSCHQRFFGTENQKLEFCSRRPGHLSEYIPGQLGQISRCVAHILGVLFFWPTILMSLQREKRYKEKNSVISQ